MELSSVMRYITLAVSAAMMAAGILLMAGFGAQVLHEQYRVIFGAVVFLFGGYRFAIAWFRNRGMGRDDDER